MMVFNALFLVYTGVLAPLQICLWNYDDPCNKFPTLFFDVLIDCFFLVELSEYNFELKVFFMPHLFNLVCQDPITQYAKHTSHCI